MPQTTNFGFPLMADTPPEGTTGKDLRDMIVGASEDSLASMVDAELQSVKSSVLPVNPNITLTWDGNTSGLDAASGYLTVYGNTTQRFYRISDTPLGCTISYSQYAYRREPKKISDYLIAYGEGSERIAFSALRDNQSCTVQETYLSGTLTFPKKGFYAYRISSSNYCTKIVTLDSPYDPKTMGSLVSETTSNKVKSISDESTDNQYPSAKAVWNALSSHSGNNADIPTKLSQLENDAGYLTQEDIAHLQNAESDDNKVNFIDDWFGDNVNSVSYPTTKAVYDFVTSHVKKEISVAESNIFIPIGEWDGDTTGRFNILGMFYKVSGSTKTPEKMKFSMSGKDAEGIVQKIDMFTDLVTDGLITDLAQMLGIYVYTMGGDMVIVVADRTGVIPAAVIEQLMGVNPGADIPYEEGTYFFGSQDSDALIFVSEASAVVGVKDYIDEKFDALCELIGSKESDT